MYVLQTPGLSQDNLDEIQQCVDEFLTGKIFNENEADQLINDILEKVMEILIKFKKPFKYMTDLMLSHRVGANMTNYTSAYFDKSLDNIYYIYYPKEKNAGGKDKPLIFALLTIYFIWKIFLYKFI